MSTCKAKTTRCDAENRNKPCYQTRCGVATEKQYCHAHDEILNAINELSLMESPDNDIAKRKQSFEEDIVSIRDGHAKQQKDLLGMFDALISTYSKQRDTLQSQLNILVNETKKVKDALGKLEQEIINAKSKNHNDKTKRLQEEKKIQQEKLAILVEQWKKKISDEKQCATELENLIERKKVVVVEANRKKREFEEKDTPPSDTPPTVKKSKADDTPKTKATKRNKMDDTQSSTSKKFALVHVNREGTPEGTPINDPVSESEDDLFDDPVDEND